MAEKEKIEGLGISGFTLGILTIIFAGWIGLMIAIIGFSFSMIQQKRHKSKAGKIGIILNVIGAVLSLAVIIFYAKIAPLLNLVSS